MESVVPALGVSQTIRRAHELACYLEGEDGSVGKACIVVSWITLGAETIKQLNHRLYKPRPWSGTGTTPLLVRDLLVECLRQARKELRAERTARAKTEISAGNWDECKTLDPLTHEQVESLIMEGLYGYCTEEQAWELIKLWVLENGYMQEAWRWVREEHPDHAG